MYKQVATTDEHVNGTIRECLLIMSLKELIKDFSTDDYKDLIYYPFDTDSVKFYIDDILNEPFFHHRDKIRIVYDNGENQYKHVDMRYKELTIDCKGNRYKMKRGDDKIWLNNRCFFEMFKSENGEYSYNMGKNTIYHIIACAVDNRFLLVPAKMVELIANRKAGWMGIDEDFYNSNEYKENLNVNKNGRIAKEKKGVAINIDVLKKCIPVFLDKYFGKGVDILRKYISGKDSIYIHSSEDDEFNGDDSKSTIFNFFEELKKQGILKYETRYK